MDPTLYNAAMEGNANVLLVNRNQFEVQVIPYNNTVLHIAAQFGQTECATVILRNCSTSLLCRVNIRGETPIHIAAKGGHIGIVSALIECGRALNSNTGASEMLRIMNEAGDTALHEAARSGSVDVVKMLIEADPEFSHLPNKAEETPLYLALERQYEDCVSEILKTCTSPCHGGPGGRTALHAAVIFDCDGSIPKLLTWKQDLCKQADSSGWTPLHYAARIGRGHMVRQLIDWDKSLAYHAAIEDDMNTALHIATSQGHINVMQDLMSSCPDCCEMVNSRGQNILHIAVEKQIDYVIKFILGRRFIDILLNQKDNNGNTPLHLLAAAKYYMPELICHPRVDQMAFNRESLTPFDVHLSGSPFHKTSATQLLIRDFQKFGAWGARNLIRDDKDYIEKTNRQRIEWHNKGVEVARKKLSTNLIVATIIATITFAAGFTLPGGFAGNEGPNQGMALLTRKAAFKAFVITDSIAVTCSSSAVFIYFVVSDVVEERQLYMHADFANTLLISSAGTMMLAFITGMYAVLGHSRGLAISVCAIGCLSYIIYSMALKSVCNIYTPFRFRSLLGIRR